LTKMSTSMISWNGPPLAVSFISHLTMLSLTYQLSSQYPDRESLLLQTGLPEKVDCSTTTSSQSPNDKNLDILHTTLNTLQSLLDMINHLGLIGIRFQSLQNTLSTFFLLLGKSKSSGGSTGESSVETECSYSSP
jgi:hypothetical protein